MKLDKKLVLVPLWVKNALIAYNKPMTAVLDKVQLLDIFSDEDVSFYKCISDIFENYNPFELANTFDIYNAYDDDQLSEESAFWMPAKYEKICLSAKLLHESLKQSPVFKDNNNASLWGTLIYTPANPKMLTTNKRDIYVQDIFPINDECLGITFAEDTFAPDKNRIVQCIKILDDYYSFEQITQTELFKYYVGQQANI